MSLRDSLEARKKSPWSATLIQYAVAIAAWLLAWAGRYLLDPWLGDNQPFITFYLAVALVAAWLNWRPAILVLVLGCLTSDYCFMPMRGSFTLVLTRPHQILEIVNYFALAGTIVLLVEFLHRAIRREQVSAEQATKAVAELQEDIIKREQAEQALRHTQQELAHANANLEHTVQERTANLQEAVQELERFSYSLIHDLRAPLRAMRSFSDLLEEKLCANCRQGPNLSLLQRIKTSALRLDQLITDSLNYTRVVHEPFQVHPVDLTPFLRDLIDSYPNLHAHAGQIHLAEKLPSVLANEAALAQCFGNLLGNAIKFIENGSEPNVTLWSEPHNGTVRIWVEDKGIGMPKEFLPRAFQMFQRAVNGYEGTGIGLAIVRKVAQRLGGNVGVESELGKGSRFWLELPAAAQISPITDHGPQT